MNDAVIPADVRKFIVDNIESIAHIEGLMLFQSGPDAGWTTGTLAARLYINEATSKELISHLQRQGFIVQKPDGRYYYAPPDLELAEMVDRTVSAYRQFLLPITHLIHEKTRDRMQEFADAFLIRKE